MNYENQVYNGGKPYIFVSYAHKDEQAALKIIHSLQKDGYRVWYDQGILPASEWDDAIAKKVKDAFLFMAITSDNYIRSDNCRDELKYARNKVEKILLVYIENVELPEGLDLRLQGKQHIYFYKYPDIHRFMNKIHRTEDIDICRRSAGRNAVTPVLFEAREEAEIQKNPRNVSAGSVVRDMVCVAGRFAEQVKEQLSLDGDGTPLQKQGRNSGGSARAAAGMRRSIGLLSIILVAAGIGFQYFINCQAEALYYAERLPGYIVYGVISLILAFAVSRLPASKIKKYAWLPILLCLILFILRGIENSNYIQSRDWMKVAGFYVNPNVFAKMAVLPMMGILAVKGHKKADNYLGLYLLWGLGLIFVLLTWGDRQNGLVIAYMALFCGLVFFKGCKYLKIAGGLLGGAVGAMVIYFMAVTTGNSTRSALYQTSIAPVLKNLSLFGNGFGHSELVEIESGYAPDDLFMVICEEAGIFGGMIVLALLLLFVWLAFRIYRKAGKENNIFGAAVALAVFTQSVLQMILHLMFILNIHSIYSMSGMIPFLTGATGTNGWWWMMAVGLLMAAWRD